MWMTALIIYLFKDKSFWILNYVLLTFGCRGMAYNLDMAVLFCHTCKKHLNQVLNLDFIAPGHGKYGYLKFSCYLSKGILCMPVSNRTRNSTPSELLISSYFQNLSRHLQVFIPQRIIPQKNIRAKEIWYEFIILVFGSVNGPGLTEKHLINNWNTLLPLLAVCCCPRVTCGNVSGYIQTCPGTYLCDLVFDSSPPLGTTNYIACHPEKLLWHLFQSLLRTLAISQRQEFSRQGNF